MLPGGPLSHTSVALTASENPPVEYQFQRWAPRSTPTRDVAALAIANSTLVVGFLWGARDKFPPGRWPISYHAVASCCTSFGTPGGQIIFEPGHKGRTYHNAANSLTRIRLHTRIAYKYRLLRCYGGGFCIWYLPCKARMSDVPSYGCSVCAAVPSVI